MDIPKKDIEILRELAKQIAEIAALPAQTDKIKKWKALNGLKPVRPMVMIDQICWNEIERGCGELTLKCESEQCRSYETGFRRLLYQWHNFPGDMVVEPHVTIYRAIENGWFSINIDETVSVTDPTNSVVGHKYADVMKTEEDLEKIVMPDPIENVEATKRRVEFAEETVGGILGIKLMGDVPFIGTWDQIAMWKSVEGALYDIIDRPEFIHKLLARITKAFTIRIDKLEERGLMGCDLSHIHCTGAFSDELPAEGFDPAKPRAKDTWGCGLAQMFSTVSPDIFEEFEVNYIKDIFTRFGLVYYGCCDPLDDRIDRVRLIPNVRKISMSPWTIQERGAEAMNGDFVFSRKPNPAYLATDIFDEALVRADLEKTRDICLRYNAPLEFILKDISTIRYDTSRLRRFSEIALETSGA